VLHYHLKLPVPLVVLGFNHETGSADPWSNVPHFNKIGEWVTELLNNQHISDASFWGDEAVLPFSQRWGKPTTYQIWGKRTTIISADQFVLKATLITSGPKSENTQRFVWMTIFYAHYRFKFNHCNVIGQQSNQIRWKKCKIKAIMPFKVIQGHLRSSRLVSIESPYMRLLISD